jgi:hypothetical protein
MVVLVAVVAAILELVVLVIRQLQLLRKEITEEMVLERRMLDVVVEGALELQEAMEQQ